MKNQYLTAGTINKLSSVKNIFRYCTIIKRMSSRFVEIDGSVLEGGGQILRISVTLSALCGIGIRISNIRAKRTKPGLSPQHLKGIQLVRDMCSGKLTGDTLGSTEIKFIPGPIHGGIFEAATKTAGSISLLLQVALPCALFANEAVELRLQGGTNADMAPQTDYTTEIFRPNLERFGATFDFELLQRGYYPKGGGSVIVHVNPIKSLKAVVLRSMGNLKRIHGWCFTAGNIPILVAYKMEDGAKHVLNDNFENITPEIICYKESNSIATRNANGTVLVCETTTGCIFGGSALGRRDVLPHDVGIAAAKDIAKTVNSEACVDEYTQDQLIIFMALAEGRSSIRVGEITLHTKSAMYIVEKLLEIKFEVLRSRPDMNIISCTGIGLKGKAV